MKIDNNAPFLVLQSQVAQLCKPLFDNSAVDYFELHQYYMDGSFVSLSNKPLLSKVYLEEEIYARQNELQESVNQAKSKIVILSKDFYHSAGYGMKKAVYNIALAQQFDILHRVYFVQQKNTHFNLFGFGSSLNKSEVINAMINNIDVLQKFGAYFEDKSRELILSSCQVPLYLPKFNHSENHENSADSKLINSKKILQVINIDDRKRSFNKPCELTKREYECLRMTIRGQTAKEVAKNLKISPRTVEIYIEHLKQKLNVPNKLALCERYFRYFDTKFNKGECDD